MINVMNDWCKDTKSFDNGKKYLLLSAKDIV